MRTNLNMYVNFFRDPIASSYDDRGDRGNDRDNCELSDRDSRDLDMNNPSYFDNTGNFDFYERSPGRQGFDGDCLDGKILFIRLYH